VQKSQGQRIKVLDPSDLVQSSNTCEKCGVDVVPHVLKPAPVHNHPAFIPIPNEIRSEVIVMTLDAFPKEDCLPLEFLWVRGGVGNPVHKATYILHSLGN